MEKNNKIQDNELHNKVFEVLKNKKLPFCYFCKGENGAEYQFAGIGVNIIQENLDTLNILGKSIPSAIIVCTNCGHINKLALGVLIPSLIQDNIKKVNTEEEKLKHILDQWSNYW